MVFSAVWVPVSIGLFVIIMTVIGYFQTVAPIEYDDLLSAIVFGIAVAGLWPLVIAIGIASLPFWLGKLIAVIQKKRQLKKEKEVKTKVEQFKALRDTFKKDEPEWALLNDLVETTR